MLAIKKGLKSKEGGEAENIHDPPPLVLHLVTFSLYICSKEFFIHLKTCMSNFYSKKFRFLHVLYIIMSTVICLEVYEGKLLWLSH